MISPIIAAQTDLLWGIATQIGLIALICGAPLLAYGAFKRQIATALGGWLVAVIAGVVFGLFVGCVIALGFMILISAIRTNPNCDLSTKGRSKNNSGPTDTDY